MRACSLTIGILVALLAISIGAAPALAVTPAEGAPIIVWQHLLGESGPEIACSADRAVDGGYILLGEAPSNASWAVTDTNTVQNDLWMVRLRANGTIQWQRLLGGAGREVGQSVQTTADGGCVVLATTFSNASGDVTGVNSGGSDTWVVKLDATGQIQWQRLIGGDLDDDGDEIRPTADGGYVIVGETYSGGSVTSAGYGRSDVWVVKLDAIGTVQWQRLFGGEYWEYGTAIRQTTDGGYLVTASTPMRNGVATELFDLWLLRLDQNGLLLWQKTLGGSGHEYAGTALPTADDGYLVVATTSSTDGDVTGTVHGSYDLWVVKLNAAREVLWQRLLGGSGEEHGASVRPTADGGYVLSTKTDSSASWNVTGTNNGQNDLWTVKLDAAGGIQWQHLYGGAGDERAAELLPADGGYLLLGTSTSSASFDVAETSHGAEDLWVARLVPVVAVPGGAGVPRDTWGIGYYDDVNGNGNTDFADVVLYFQQIKWIIANEPVAAFDYNGNGKIDYADVALLFEYL